MMQNLTLVCKLNPTPQQVAKIEATLKAFAVACNYANEHVKSSITSKRTIQTLVYDQVRGRFELSANLVVRVCARVGANRKTAQLKGKEIKKFRPTSADYDSRIFALREKDWSAGVDVIPIAPQYTSQTCHQCLHIGHRSSKSFRCSNCGYHGDADFNGSQVIRLLGSCVTRAEESWLSCEITRGSKAHALCVA